MYANNLHEQLKKHMKSPCSSLMGGRVKKCKLHQSGEVQSDPTFQTFNLLRSFQVHQAGHEMLKQCFQFCSIYNKDDALF